MRTAVVARLVAAVLAEDDAPEAVRNVRTSPAGLQSAQFRWDERGLAVILKVAQAMRNARLSSMTPDELRTWLRNRYWVEDDERAMDKEYVEAQKNERKELFGNFDQLGKDLEQRQKLYELLDRAAGMGEDGNGTEYTDKARDVVHGLRNLALFAKYLPESGPVDFDKIPSKYSGILYKELPYRLFAESKLPSKRSFPSRSSDISLRWRQFNRNAVLAGKYGRVLKRLYEDGGMRTQKDWLEAVQANAATMPKRQREDLKRWLDSRDGKALYQATEE